MFETVISGPILTNRRCRYGDSCLTALSVGPSCWATGISSLITGSAFRENVSSWAIASRCSVRNVGKTWKIADSDAWFWAAVRNVVSPAVIRLRSAAGSALSALNVVPPFRTSDTTELCSMSRTWSNWVRLIANGGRLPST